MSETVGSIAISVTVDIEPLRKALKNGSKSIASFSKTARKGINSFGKVSAVASAAIVAATAKIYSSQSKVIDSLAKTSDALGITIRNMQSLNHIAELNGVSSDAMAKGLRRMQRGLGEAARKGGATADALEDAGVSIQSIINLSPEKQMQALADAIGNIENQSVKASIASDLFGRDGINMLKVLTQLRKSGVEPTAKELDKLGITMTRVDAAKVEAANDAFFKLKEALGGAAKTLTVELAPYVEEVANRFLDAARAGNGFGEQIKSGIESSIRFAAKFANVLHGLKVVFKGLELVAVSFSSAVFSVFQLIIEGAAMLGDAVLKDVNGIIAALNKIPGVDIAKVDMFTDSPFMEGLRNMGDVARNTVTDLRSELHDLAMEPLPSDEVEAFFDAVESRANSAAESLANALPNGTKKEDEEEEDEENLPIEPFLDPELIAEKHEAALELDKQFWDAKQMLADHGLQALTRMTELSYGSQAGSVADAFSSILSSTATHSKKAFEINKKASLANAAISGWGSAVKAWEAGMSTGGPWAPFIAAAYTAASLAKTGAQIKSIKSQSFGGGGSGSAGGGTGGSAGALPGASTPQAAAAPTMTTVNLQGDSFSRESVGSLIGTINDALDSGYTLRLGT